MIGINIIWKYVNSEPIFEMDLIATNMNPK